jgi:hypothetical protein
MFADRNVFSERRDYLWESFGTNRTECPCDFDFCELLENRPHLNIERLFHMGSGGHHHVGITTHRLGIQTVSITFSATEHAKYSQLLELDQSLSETYVCYLGNVYTTPFEIFREFDCATLFHLCESGGTIEEAARAVERILDALRPEGHLVFYTASNGWERASVVRESFVRSGRIAPSEEPVNNLWFHKKIS